MDKDHIRDGFGAVRPYLYARPDMIDFAQSVFGASILASHDTPTGAHVEACIEDSVFILETATEFPPQVTPTLASVYLYVKDVDDVYAKALAAGAESISAPEDKPYDERQCGIKDLFGNTWWVSTYLGAGS